MKTGQKNLMIQPQKLISYQSTGLEMNSQLIVKKKNTPQWLCPDGVAVVEHQPMN